MTNQRTNKTIYYTKLRRRKSLDYWIPQYYNVLQHRKTLDYWVAYYNYRIRQDRIRHCNNHLICNCNKNKPAIYNAGGHPACITCYNEFRENY
tara:strand:+ start:147 stop:425 length:279 start_codon:yes stop_codon:yes gene_type:complete